MVQKYYAVKKGRKPGLYTSWPQAQNQVSHYPKAEYKSFKDKVQALQYLNNGLENAKETSQGLQAYVDGSFDKKQKSYSYGVVLLEDGKLVAKLANSDNDPRYAASNQIAGECYGCLNAIKWAINHSYDHITIFYDYVGIEKWAKKEWQAKKVISQDYVRFYDRFAQNIEVDFVKVKAHSGVSMNELADQLAKDALKQ